MSRRRRRDDLVRALRFVSDMPGQSSTDTSPHGSDTVTVLLRSTLDLDAWDRALEAARVPRAESWRGQHQRRHRVGATTIDVIVRTQP